MFWLEVRGIGGEGVGGGQRGEMVQTMYAHMNKWTNKQKKRFSIRQNAEQLQDHRL
jgi:hypothetical protein